MNGYGKEVNGIIYTYNKEGYTYSKGAREYRGEGREGFGSL